MDCFFLDKVSWQHSQGLYHAAAHLGQEALFILRPSTPYVCIGYHQDAEQEIDLEYASANHIPVFRREVGGGAVYLDGEQLFYQLVLRADRPSVPSNKAEFYRRYLAPVVETYRAFGVAAEYKPVNDIVANGRKVSGNGAAEIDGMLVLVGNFIMDFDHQTMAKTLRVPDEKFRDKVYKTLEENLSTMKRETGTAPATEALASDLVGRYEALLGPMRILHEPDQALVRKADELVAAMHTSEWLHANDQRRARPESVKISRGGLCHAEYAQDARRPAPDHRGQRGWAASRCAHLRRFLLLPRVRIACLGTRLERRGSGHSKRHEGCRTLLRQSLNRVPRRAAVRHFAGTCAGKMKREDGRRMWIWESALWLG